MRLLLLRLSTWSFLAGLATAAPALHTIVFLSDFGTTDDSVAICKGVMWQLAPQIRIVDLTHAVPAYDVATGARLLAGVTAYYPRGTVFVGVVDPGVGTTRRAVVARSRRGQYFVLPDNGLLDEVAAQDGIVSARRIVNPTWQRPGVLSTTFHGRDVFSPVAARLARGDDWRNVGPPATALVQLPTHPARIEADGLHGLVIGTDGPYGNLVTNIPAELFARLGWTRPSTITLQVGARTVSAPFVGTFGDVPADAPLLYIDSRGRLAMGINLGNFATTYGITPPVELRIPTKPPG